MGPSGGLATPKQVAAYLHTSEGSLAQQRYKGTGPRFIRVGRRILYRWDDVHAYIEAHLMTRTDDRPGIA